MDDDGGYPGYPYFRIAPYGAIFTGSHGPPWTSMELHPQPPRRSQPPHDADRAKGRGVDQGRAAAHVAAVQRAVPAPGERAWSLMK